MLKVIVTGPESTGKTTLIKELGSHFQIPCIKEYSREYISALKRSYTSKDILVIAKEHINKELCERPLSLLDTDLITLKIWSEYKYGFCHHFIKSQIRKQKQENRIYLLCKPDIPWEFDSQREHPKDREHLFEIYKTELVDRNYIIISGSYKKRVASAIKKINSCLKNN
ncbi:MAG: ATP-binding protein [Bacteroidota bacterium]|nr:ATP-binding protein [Bacteroidota bacterium]